MKNTMKIIGKTMDTLIRDVNVEEAGIYLDQVKKDSELILICMAGGSMALGDLYVRSTMFATRAVKTGVKKVGLIAKDYYDTTHRVRMIEC